MKIQFKRSKEIGKIPSVDNLDYGEIAINYSSGEGNAFFSTKKADNTIAMFSDNAHWDKKINKIKNLNQITPIKMAYTFVYAIFFYEFIIL